MLQFLPDHFQTSLVSCLIMRGGTLLVLGHGSKVNFGTLLVKPCVDTIQTTVLVQSFSKFICELKMMREEPSSC